MTQTPEPYLPGPDDEQWWYNDRTGEVEHGPQSLGVDRIGPFRTREEAAHALDTIAARARDWEDEESEER